jgi:hypothetical protein
VLNRELGHFTAVVTKISQLARRVVVWCAEADPD